jgi:hypothetical protein
MYCRRSWTFEGFSALSVFFIDNFKSAAQATICHLYPWIFYKKSIFILYGLRITNLSKILV